ncbi:glycosyltransferase [Xylophilus rhododendri]|uniref:Glycosyltransferase n=1 Tax=Xylophilus rhododendri TaxID=2697032 RepID=A0A857J166_9BURK|nr:glycosyltransferase [Xylophilus rhododendri]QHI97620.1 glycosyltransferase [Xylophilus rhododendri]
MLGIVIPAHNEQDCIEDCLVAARRAARHPALHGEEVEIVVVLDSCSDRTGLIATRQGVLPLHVRLRNVGAARAAGAELALARGARWLAFTDADSRVQEDWLAEQLALQADAVCGTVCVDDWTAHGEHAELLRHHFAETYFDREGHRHIHGANLGVSAAAYRLAGGFRHLACSEDVALVEALQACGAEIAWSARPRVVTSARRHARAVGGFADALLGAVAQRLAAATAAGSAGAALPA